MSKKRKNNNKNVDRTMKIVLPEGLSSNEMRDIIVSSLLAYDQAKKEPEKEALEKEMQERRKQLGYKDYSRCRPIRRFFLTILNRIKVFFKILFMPKEKITGDTATTGLMKMAVSLLFGAVKWLLRLVAFISVLYYPLSLLIPHLTRIELVQYPAFIIVGIIAFLFGQLFRLASIEVEKMKDHNYVVDIFAAVAAIVAIIISVIDR